MAPVIEAKILSLLQCEKEENKKTVLSWFLPAVHCSPMEGGHRLNRTNQQLCDCKIICVTCTPAEKDALGSGITLVPNHTIVTENLHTVLQFHYCRDKR